MLISKETLVQPGSLLSGRRRINFGFHRLVPEVYSSYSKLQIHLDRRSSLSKALSAVLTAMLLVATTPGGTSDALAWGKHEQIRHLVTLPPIPDNPELNVPPPFLNQGDAKPSGLMLKGGVTLVVPKGTPLKLKLSSVPSTGLKMMDRDEDGNLLPAQLGQVITAKTTEDLFVADNKVIPAGTIFRGQVSRIYEPKRVGRPGALSLSFNEFQTPDGRKFAFHCEADNKIESTLKTKGKGLGTIAAHVAGGAATGALIAYQLFGLEQTIAMHGYNIAGGAAAGALGGMAVALLRKGRVAVLEPGDDLNMSIDCDLLMTAAVEPKPKKDPKLEGLDIDVITAKIIKDGLEGHCLRVDAYICNNTKYRLSSIDLYLEDDNGGRFPVCTSMEEEAEILFRIDPYSTKHVLFNFQVEFPKLKRKLVWLEHASQTILTKQPLP